MRILYYINGFYAFLIYKNIFFHLKLRSGSVFSARADLSGKFPDSQNSKTQKQEDITNRSGICVTTFFSFLRSKRQSRLQMQKLSVVIVSLQENK